MRISTGTRHGSADLPRATSLRAVKVTCPGYPSILTVNDSDSGNNLTTSIPSSPSAELKTGGETVQHLEKSPSSEGTLRTNISHSSNTTEQSTNKILYAPAFIS